LKSSPKLFIFLGMVLSFTISGCQSDKIPWIDLITEKGLADFIQMGGEAGYMIEDGIITGTTVANTENSFLCTKQEYGDFILEFNIKADTAVNSGVQIRSHAYLNGRVHGYQVEVDPSARAYSGGIYDEARRAWLNDLSGNEAGRMAYKPGEWNHYRIECFGNSTKTWINGTMCANLMDDADTSGFIAFQVHSINIKNKPWAEDVQIQWKDIRILTSGLDRYRTLEHDAVPAKTTLINNQLTEQEQADGWEMLFDGLSTDKWRGAHMESFPAGGWVVEAGMLKINAESGGESTEAGDIVTIEVFDDFELKLDFNLTPGANSGIKYYLN